MITVEYLDHMGSDLDVVNAARVSFNKESDWDQTTTIYMDGSSPKNLSSKDRKLIHYLATHKHKSPFNHAFAKFRVKAPIFVARQLVKHEYLVWNEVSRRYVDDDIEVYTPEVWRSKAEDKKQGSGDPFEAEKQKVIAYEYYNAMCAAVDYYTFLVQEGVAPEQARIVLPQSLMTEWIWSGSLYAFAKMVALRTTPDAQYESRLVAEQISTTMNELFPISWDALKDNIL